MGRRDCLYAARGISSLLPFNRCNGGLTRPTIILGMPSDFPTRDRILNTPKNNLSSSVIDQWKVISLILNHKFIPLSKNINKQNTKTAVWQGQLANPNGFSQATESAWDSTRQGAWGRLLGLRYRRKTREWTLTPHRFGLMVRIPFHV